MGKMFLPQGALYGQREDCIVILLQEPILSHDAYMYMHLQEIAIRAKENLEKISFLSKKTIMHMVIKIQGQAKETIDSVVIVSIEEFACIPEFIQKKS